MVWISYLSLSFQGTNSFSMLKIPFGLRITPNVGFVFILKNHSHNPLRIKDASSGVNCQRFSAGLLLLWMSAEYTLFLILMGWPFLGSPECCEKKQSVILDSMPHTQYQGVVTLIGIWKPSLEDLLLGQVLLGLKQSFWASSFHL